MVDFRNLKKTSVADLKAMVSQMHRAKEGAALVDFTDVIPAEILLRSGLSMAKKVAPAASDMEPTEAPDSFTAGKNRDITPELNVEDVAEAGEEPEMLNTDEQDRFARLESIIDGLDATQDGRLAKEARDIVSTFRQIMNEDRQNAARNPMRRLVAAPGYKSIWNMDVYQRDKKGKVLTDNEGKPMTGRLSCIATDRYHVTQPRRSFGKFVDELLARLSDEQSANVYAKLEQSVSYHDLAVIIDDPSFQITPEDGRVINLGFHLGGGFRPGRSSYVGGWEIRRGRELPDGTYEVGCMNVFNLDNAMGSASLPHTMDEDTVIAHMVNYIETIESRGKKLLAKINGAIRTPVPDEDVMWVMGAVGLTPTQVVDSYKFYKTQAEDEQGHMYGVYQAILGGVTNKYQIKTAEEKFTAIEDIIDDPDEVFDNVKQLKLEAEAKMAAKMAASSEGA